MDPVTQMSGTTASRRRWGDPTTQTGEREAHKRRREDPHLEGETHSPRMDGADIYDNESRRGGVGKKPSTSRESTVSRRGSDRSIQPLWKPPSRCCGVRTAKPTTHGNHITIEDEGA